MCLPWRLSIYYYFCLLYFNRVNKQYYTEIWDKFGKHLVISLYSRSNIQNITSFSISTAVINTVVSVAMHFAPGRAGSCSGCSFPLELFPRKVNTNMADFSDVVSKLSSMDLGSSGDDTERAEYFWNRLCIEMKFSVETLAGGSMEM